MQRPTRAEIAQQFLRGGNCAQAVLGAYCDETGYDREECDRIAACFGGGMYLGETCGALTGALMAIGILADTPQEAHDKAAELEAQFRGRMGGTLCRDLLQYDVSDPEQLARAKESGRLIDYCPTVVETALDLLEELL